MACLPFWKQISHPLKANFEKLIDRNKKGNLEFLLQYLLFTRYAATAWGIGHAPFLWELAASERVHYEHFQRIMRRPEPGDLLVSFDGSSFAFPDEATKRGFYQGKEKFHLHWKAATHCFEEFNLALFNLTSIYQDNYQLSEEQIQWYKDRGCVVRDITCQAGGI
jgi:hypothetical protein